MMGEFTGMASDGDSHSPLPHCAPHCAKFTANDPVVPARPAVEILEKKFAIQIAKDIKGTGELGGEEQEAEKSLRKLSAHGAQWQSQCSELPTVGPQIGLSPTRGPESPDGTILQTQMQTQYYFAWSPAMALRVMHEYKNVVPCRLFRTLSCFNVLSPGKPYVPLYKTKEEAALLYKELKVLKRNPTVIDDHDNGRYSILCPADRCYEPVGDLCEAQSPLTPHSGRSARPKAASAVKRAAPQGVKGKFLGNVGNVRTALERASQSANDVMTQYTITFDPTYLLDLLLNTKCSIAPLKSDEPHHERPAAPFAPGHLQMQGDFFLANIANCQDVQITEGPMSVKSSKTAADDTFADGSRRVDKFRKQERDCKRARLYLGIQESKNSVAQMTANMKEMEEAMRQIDAAGDDTEGVGDLDSGSESLLDFIL